MNVYGLSETMRLTGWPAWKVQKISDQFALGKANQKGRGQGSRRYWTQTEINFMQTVDAIREGFWERVQTACRTHGVQVPKWYANVEEVR